MPASATPGEMPLLWAAVKPCPLPPGVVCGCSAAPDSAAGFVGDVGLALLTPGVGGAATLALAAYFKNAARYPIW